MENTPVEPLFSEEQAGEITRLSQDAPAPIQRRAALILLYGSGASTAQAAVGAGLSKGRARYWRRRFQIQGMAIFIPTRQPAQNPGAEAQSNELQPAVLTPREKPGVIPTDSMAEAAQKLFGFFFAEMLRHEEGTRLGADNEELHDMRVSSRRLRVAFELFAEAFRPKALKRQLKGLRQTGRTLGKVRDLDVLLEKTELEINLLPAEHRLGLEPLLASWGEMRQQARQALVAYLDSKDYQVFKQKFTRFVESPSIPRIGPQAGFANATVYETVPILIYNRITGIRGFEGILASASLDRLHLLRIEVKKLRYTLEFFQEVLPPEVNEQIKLLKAVQDHLGNLNDARVACRMIQEFISIYEAAQAGKPLSEWRSLEDVAAFLAVKYGERHQLAVSFPAQWDMLNDPGFRQQLGQAGAILYSREGEQ